MSADRKAQIARVNDEIWNQGNMDAVARLFAPNIVRHQPPMPDVVGLEAVTQYIRDIRSAYSQLRLQIHDLIIDGDISASRLASLLAELRDQLAMHFALEEAYGYFHNPVEVEATLAETARRLRAEHSPLYLRCSQLADHAENL